MNRPMSVSIALAFIALNALIWFAFAALLALGAIPGLPDNPSLQWGMAALAFIGSVVLALLSFLLAKRNRIAFYLSISGLAFISVIVFADDIGVVDLVAFALSAFPLVLLILGRSWFNFSSIIR
jgi:hypothetical protein